MEINTEDSEDCSNDHTGFRTFIKTAEKPWQSFERIQYNSEGSPIITSFFLTASM